MQHIQCFLVGLNTSFSPGVQSDRQLDQGQGGAQGIEDGLALGIALCGATADEVKDRLEIYENVRRKRASAIQILSNAGVDQIQYIAKEILQYTDSVPGMSSTYIPLENSAEIERG